MKTLKLWTGKSRFSDGKGKELADISKTEYETVPGRVGFMEAPGSFGGNTDKYRTLLILLHFF